MATGTTINSADVPVKSLQSRRVEATNARKKYDLKWARNWNYYRGTQWEGDSKAASFQTSPVYNKHFEFVEVMRGFLSDNKWGIDVLPARLPKKLQAAVDASKSLALTGASIDPLADPQQLIVEKADSVNRLLDYRWSEARMQNKLAQVLLHTFNTGTGFIKSVFDPLNVGDSGIGQIEDLVVNPLYIYPDPDATCVQDASFLIEQHTVSVRWIIDRYPDKWQELAKSLGGTIADVAGRGTATQGPSAQDEGRKTDIWEYWYNDATILEDDPSGATTPKYPKGRYTLMTTEGVVLDDKPCVYDHWPYTRFVEIPMPGEFWGGCTVDKAIGIQDSINQILRSIIDNGLWLVHGIWIADNTSGLTPKKLADYGPRDVIIKNVGSTVTRDAGAQLPNHLFSLLEQQCDAYDKVVGLPDVLRGIVPSRQPVQTTMIQQESGEVRTRERSRRVEESLEDLGRQWLSLVTNHWADKRSIRTIRPTGGFDMFNLSKKDMEGWQFDIFVKPGSTTPLDLTASLQRAKEYRVEMGIAIPDEWFLRYSGLPGIESAMSAVRDEANNGADSPNPATSPMSPLDGPPTQGDQIPQDTQGMPPVDPTAPPLDPNAALAAPAGMAPPLQ